MIKKKVLVLKDSKNSTLHLMIQEKVLVLKDSNNSTCIK